MSKFNSMGWNATLGAVMALAAGVGCAQGPETQADAVEGAGPDASTQFRPLTPEPESAPPEAPTETSVESSHLAFTASEVPVADPTTPAAAAPSTAPPGTTVPASIAKPATVPVSDAIEAVDRLVQEGAASMAQKQQSGTASGFDRSALDVAYFNTAEFNRQFATSFLRRSDVEPTLGEDEILTLQEVFELIKSDKRDRALEKLERENQRFSTPTIHYLIAQLRFEKAKAALDEGDTDGANQLYDETVTHYEAAIKDFPNYLNAHHYLALVHFQRERFREAAKHFSTELRLGGVDRLTYGLLGISLMNEELYLPAETAFRQALLLDPFDQNWSLGLSRCLFKQQRYGAAATLVGGMIKEEPDRAELWLLQGNAYVGLKETDRAAENFRIAEALGGATQQSLDLMADIYANQGLGDLAVDGYLKALAKSTTPSPSRALRSARIMTQNGDVASAKRLLDGVAAALGESINESDRDTVLKLRSKIAVIEGDTEDEITVLREIVDRNPLDGEAFVLLGEAYERAEQYDEAAQSFETAASIDDSAAEGLRKHGEMLVRRRLYTDAIPLLKASLQIQEKATLREYLDAVEKAAKRATK